VVHEQVPWQQAAIHGGDWLVKLLLIPTVVTKRRGPTRYQGELAGPPCPLT
jgi:hypothetical protein